MSLMKTLAKVAIGVAVAKGASSMMKSRSGAQTAGTDAGLGGLLGGLAGGTQGGGAGLQDMLGGLMGGAQSGAGAAGLQDMLGGLMGGAQGGTGGLGGLLENLGGAGGAGGGLQDMLGGLAGSAGAGGLLGALGGAVAQRPESNNASFGEVLNSAFDQTPQEAIEPSADQEAAAALMLRAMIQAAKSDGKLDDGEQEKLMGQLGGDIDDGEAAFLRTEMQRPVDVNALVADVPRGMGPQVYAMSLLAIDLDSQTEAQYLHSLAQGLGMDATSVNDVHAQLGVPSLYT
ncbi:tellurite resistance TerB family protein [Tateyamaria sp. Alg231-49]|uniref:tellurite resistance TerB family protein n=1 Tax=Tateyamaria sp. Alg231-49 TaxID=1922219 RepID=UPI000D55C5E9|nr:tellurite resistance TerB family protein [Tateyamaria sp. Alg231-49]